METRWRVELLGGLLVVGAEGVITRFRTRKTGALLAFLAFYRQRVHPRELLIEMLWPEEAPESGRAKLRVALSSLKRQLEPPGTPAGSILLADRLTVRLNSAAVTTDVALFETALEQAASAPIETEQMQCLATALDLYRGPLLPDQYESWVVPEQQRLAHRFHQAARQMVYRLDQAGQLERAVQVAGRAVAADPLQEEAQADLIGLLLRAGQRGAAVRQYRELERLLREELGEAPSPEIRRLIESNRRSGGAAQGGEPISPGPLGPGPEIAAAPLPSAAPQEADRRVGGTFPTAAAGGYLPAPANRFFGREAEIDRLQQLLLEERARLVTLTGPGGSGKTRLALAAAARMRAPLGGAVWFVPLVDLADGRRIAEAIRDVLRLPRTPDQAALDQIAGALRDEPALLVLDNLEHLLDGAAPLLQALLERVPSVQCLVTSRQVVNIAAERELLVMPLPVPGESVGCRVWGVGADDGVTAGPYTPHPTPHTLLQFPSVALFVDRVQAVRPDFQVTAGNAAAVAEICRQLEGIPLAIELAAAHARLLSPAQMVRQLGRRFDLLVSRRRDLHARHQTLRATLEWSYRLLSPELQRCFRRLAVFRGGWTFDAAAAVCGEEVAPILEQLGQLRECSLVLCEEAASEMRYRLLETVREFGWDELERYQEAAETRRRHAGYFVRLAEAAEGEMHGRDQIVWYKRLDREHDNVRAALAWAVETSEVELGLWLAGRLEWFWRTRGHLAEGREHLARLLALPAAQSRARARARALQAAGMIARDLGDSAAALSLCEEGLALARGLGDADLIRDAAAGSLACVLLARGDTERAEPLFLERLEMARQCGDEWSLTATLHDLGRLAWRRGQLARARAFFEESLALRRKRGDHLGVVAVLGNLGCLMAWEGDFAAARDCIREVLPIARALEAVPEIARARHNLGMASLDLGEYEEAEYQFEQALPTYRATGDVPGSINTLNTLGECMRAHGNFERARGYYERALALAREIDHSWSIARSLNNLGLTANARGKFSEARQWFHECLALDRAADRLPGIAACLSGLAGTALGEREPARAACLLGAAARLPVATDPPLRPIDRAEYSRWEAAARAALGESAFAAAWERGQNLPLEEAIRVALDPDPTG